MACALGCKSSRVIGGSHREAVAEFETRYEFSDGSSLEITVNREEAATTQPSVRVDGSDAAPVLGATTRPSDFGGVSFAFPPAVRKTFAERHAKWLAVIFLICAVACFYMRKYLYGVTCLAIGILSALHPIALSIGAIVVLLGTLWLMRRNIQQLASGIRNADARTPPNIDVASIVRESVDRSTQKMAGIDATSPTTNITIQQPAPVVSVRPAPQTTQTVTEPSDG